MSFVPSAFSYGDSALVAESAPAASGGMDVGSAVTLGVSAVRGILGLDDDARATVAELEGKLEVAQKKRANNALPGAWYWDDQIIKHQARLVDARAKAASETRTESLSQTRDVAITVAVLAGVVGVGILVVNQVQKTRLTQIQIRQAGE